MTVIFSKRCELALQAVLFLSVQENERFVNSKEVSKNLKVPKEFVAKVLQALTYKEIVASKKGKTGGFYLAKPPENVFLIDLVEAVDGLEIFSQCMLGFRACSNEEPCPIHGKWGKIRERLHKLLSDTTLANINSATVRKINALTQNAN